MSHALIRVNKILAKLEKFHKIVDFNPKRLKAPVNVYKIYNTNYYAEWRIHAFQICQKQKYGTDFKGIE